MPWVGGLTKVSERVAKDVFKSILKRADGKTAEGILKDSVRYFNSVDTEDLMKSARVSISKSSLKIKATFATNTAYDTFVRFGIGSNRKYGRRDYLTFAAKKWFKYLVNNKKLKNASKIGVARANFIAKYEIQKRFKRNSIGLITKAARRATAEASLRKF